MSKNKSNENNQEKANETRALLIDVFKEYGNLDLPEELKDEVFDSLETIKLAANLLDLFTIKFVKTEVDILNEVVENKNDDTAQ